MRIAILWSRLSGYLNACLKELASREGVELLVVHEGMADEAPFEDEQFNWIENRITWRSQPGSDQLRQQLLEFSPDILVMCGWHIPAYRKLGTEFRGRCIRVMTMDHGWDATLKQRVGSFVSPYYVQPIADLAWVPGERQAIFARRLGFEQRAILRGLYACDQPVFSEIHRRRISSGNPVPRAFLFIGRFSAEKGLNTLVEGFRRYRAGNPGAWPLVCCGTGPLKPLLEHQDGIHMQGFVQPERLPEVLSAGGCLVLPSTFDPWAVVIHEAASAGLAILASERAGASVHLVQPGYNGFIFGSGDAEGLANYMTRLSAMSDEQLDEMSRASHSLSQQFSPRIWADTLLNADSLVPRPERRRVL